VAVEDADEDTIGIANFEMRKFESITRRASAGDTSVTISTSPSPEMQRSSAWAGASALRKMTFCTNGPRG